MKSLNLYTGNASFAARNAAFESEGQRFFVRPDGWADVKVASLAALTKLLPEGEFKPGGTAASKLQIRWTKENVEALGYEFQPVVATVKSTVDATDFMLKAASK
jgi:hypothetical protein